MVQYSESCNVSYTTSVTLLIVIIIFVSSFQYSGEFLPDPKFIHMVQDLFKDDSEESEFFSLFNKGNPSKKISNTCPFGLSATVLETIEEDLPDSFDDM